MPGIEDINICLFHPVMYIGMSNKNLSSVLTKALNLLSRCKLCCLKYMPQLESYFNT